MFGFLGHWEARIEYNAAGVNNGINRFFSAWPGFEPTALGFQAFKFEVDTNNDGAPNSYSGFTNVPYRVAGPPVKQVYGRTGNDMYAIQTFVVPGTGPTAVLAQYNGTSPLSPRTRGCRLTIYRPDLYRSDGSFNPDNNSGKTLASNIREGVLTSDWRQFPNLETFWMEEEFTTAFTYPLPESVKYLTITEMGQLTTFPNFPSAVEYARLTELHATFSSSINTKLQNCTNLKWLYFYNGSPFPTTRANATTTLTGTLDLSMAPNLQDLLLTQNSSLTGLTLHPSVTGLIHFDVSSTGITSPTIFNTVLTSNPNLISFVINNNTLNWSRNFTNSDFGSSLRYFWIYGTSTTGSITLSTAKPNLLDFRTNANNETGSVHNVVDVTGLTGCRYLDLGRCAVQDLQLPVNTVMTTLQLRRNQLSLTTNPNIVSQINALTGLVNLFLSDDTSGTGQTSTDGLGANPTLSGLTNLVQLIISDCKITGTLTLPNTNKITFLRVGNNTGLTSVANLASHTNLTTFSFQNSGINPDLTNHDLINNITGNSSAITTVDFSGRATTNPFIEFNFNTCTSLTSVVFPTTAANSVFAGTGPIFSSCSSLTTITNAANISWSAGSSGAQRSINFTGCAIDMTWPFGTNNFRPYQIFIGNNGMSSANVDATINNIYTNRAAWTTISGDVRVLNIGGTNGAVTGTFQAPTGFVLGVSDGTPASAKEQLYVLQNNYNWANLTYN